MSFNVKHYVAIGLGFAVFAGFAMHKSTFPTQPVAFETHLGEFKPLSSFEHSIGNVPKITSIETELAPISNPISTLQLATEAKPGAQHVTFDTSDSLTNETDFAVPDFVDDAIMELSGVKPVETTDGGVLQAEPATADLAATSAFELSQPTEKNTDLGVQRNYELPNSRWIKNSTINPAIVDDGTPVVDVQTSDVTILEGHADSSIIVEPISGKPDLVEETQFIDGSNPTTLESNNSASSSLKLAASENRNEVDKSVMEISKEFSSKEVASKSSDRIAPLTVPLQDAAAQQAVHHIEYGKSLSRRGAAFAARQEFYTALRVTAESNDATTGTKNFTRALSQAIMAMKEARDFVQEDTEAGMLLDVSSIVETHRSKIIDKAQAALTNPSQAMESYFVFAQNKLDEASGRNAVSAEILFCLGKLHTTISNTRTVPDKIDVARAIAYHNAALMSDKNSFRSANELGVLLVQMGQLEQATELFKRSLIAQPTPQAWQNLAKTHRRLGQQKLAHLAETEYVLLSQTQMASSSVALRWVPTESFKANPPIEFLKAKRVANRPASPSAEPKTTSDKAQSKIKSFGARLKELF